MKSNTIFFSYSRTDSDFVLQLAKDLRDAGAEIWLDQLDIKPGTRWDASVEKALKEAKRLIVILSPESVSSNNVMDEVSYALEDGKTIFPVLLKPCDTPFRLRRVQRIDFTNDYQTALKKLLEVLGYGTQGLSNVENPEVDAGDAEDTSNDETPNSESSADEESENALWEQAKSENTISAYQKYLDETEIGLYKENAVQTIKQIQLEQKVKDLENLVWERAKAQNTLDAYNKYIKEFPEGTHKLNALEAIKNLKESENKPERREQEGQEKPSGKKKRTQIIVGVASLAIVAVVVFVLIGNASKKKQEARVQMQRDSIAQAIILDSLRQDSIKKAAILDSLRRDSIGLGKLFRGGIIFEVDDTGEHGKMVSAGDLNNGDGINWDEANQLCAELNSENSQVEWKLPSLAELLAIAELNPDLEDSVKLKGRYWSSTPQESGMQGYEFKGVGSFDFWQSKTSKNKVRAVREF